MSWAEEDWTVGLSGRVLQKVKELQVHQERLSRENKQKQLQLDNIHTSLEKQTVKYEEVRAELQSVQRELQCVQEEAKTALTAKERLSQEFQTKQAQVCSLEGQLDAARTQNNKLTQEIKRLEAELEKLQNSSKVAENSLFSTPCWNPSPHREHHGNRPEESSGPRDGQSRTHQSPQPQFSDTTTPSLPRQHSTPFAGFPWERDESTPAARRRLVPSPQTQAHYVTSQEQGTPRDCGTDSRKEADEMRSRVAALEAALLEQTKTLKCVQAEQVQTKKELAAKELSLQSSHGELTVTLTRLTQEKDRVSTTEHRLKQLQEELKCQRQNAESSRLQHQQRTKELEKQHQRDVSELQKERQLMEKQHQQEVNKLNQELQQAAALHNALQAQFDKLSLQKQLLDKEFDSLKAKLKWTEDQLKESQKKETQLQAKLMETVREAETVTVSLEQSRKRERALEEEGKRLAEELADALRQIKELQEQKSLSAVASQPVQFCPVGSSSFPSPPRTATKKTAFQQKMGDDEETVYERRAEKPNLYSSDREPGEGIDSEHIAVSSATDSESKIRNESMKSDTSVPSESFFSLSSNISEKANKGMDSDDSHLPQTLKLSTDKTHLPSEKPVVSQDLKQENDMLRSELQDVREELQKRLQDLEVQRRAEAEARTRLKQVSRKHANQSTENEEKNKEFRAQMERERAETEKLKKHVAALEADLKREKEQRTESSPGVEDRETEMIEFNIMLKKQLAEVKAQLALEQEERKQEQDERNQKTHLKRDIEQEQNSKVAELTAEVEELRRRIKNLKESQNRSDNSPLKYLGLHDDEINSNVVCSDNKLLPSSEQHQLFCQSINKHNMLVSAGKTFEDEETIDLEPSSMSDEDVTDHITSDLEDLSLSELTYSDVSEVQHLKMECKKQTERATQAQVKLEALQKQVTRQTHQLTTAFEKQTLHISGLLAELQDKERVLLSQGEELLQCKKELQAVKSSTDFDAVNHPPNQLDKKDLNVVWTENSPERGRQDHEQSKPAQNSDKHPHLDCLKIGDIQHFQISDSEDQFHELLTVQQDDQLSEQKLADIRVPVCKTKPLSCIETKVTGISVKSCVQERDAQNQQENFMFEKQAPTSSVKGTGEQIHNCDIMGDTARGAKEDLVQESQAKVNDLQQEVVALQMKVKALSHKAQQQAEELAIWKLSFHPPPTFNILELSDAQEPNSAVSLQQTDLDERIQSQEQAQTHTLDHSCKQDNITVVREDELLLSCSSMKLQGRLLYSRVEPENLLSSESAMPKFNQDAANNNNQESQKETPEVDTSHHLEASTAIQLKEKANAELLQMSSPVQPCVSKDTSKDFETSPMKRLTSDETCGNKSSDKILRSISSQTEESLSLRNPLNPSVATQTHEGEEEEEKVEMDARTISHVSLPEGAASQQALLLTSPFPIPSDPARLAERIRRNRTQLSAAFDDTEYEPYGLPEVVMKGFADIPSGPSCPYIVRRGLLGTTVVPVAEKDEEMD